ncbi:DNA recombination protein RmuC [Polymorphobacter fuscus]|uniref:DNA recombination protein RmuC n=1 Tax=Sandarakinorhabdus fusca TaxID=1439888 RepID=UPI001FB143FC|nr:DNA recombination protein RmuC [Polymorphobacter fuscus]
MMIAGAAGLLVALLLGWALWARPLAAMRGERDALKAETAMATAEVVRQKELRAGHAVEVQTLTARNAELAAAEHQREALAGELAAVRAAQAERDRAHAAEVARTVDTFQALAAKALDGAQAKLAERAEALMVRQREAAGAGLEANRNQLAELIAPVKDTLVKYEARLGEVEAARTEAYGGLKEQLAAVAAGQRQVSDEAAKLVSALRSSSKTSGSWGEQQLLNTLEMAGLRAGVDFTLQTHVAGETMARRPDAIINLPGGRQLIIDSKCSLKDYLEGVEATGEGERLAAFKRHAESVRRHAKGLSDKAYWNEFGTAADFVVMFIPGENFLSAAMEHDLPLLGWAFEQRILLAGPINLLAIAKTVALVWRQEKLAEEAREIGKLGAELHAAIATMADHVAGVGRNLSQAVGSYNAFVGSLEGNVLPKARRFTEMGVEKGKKSVAAVGVVDAAVRAVAARELLPRPAPAQLPSAAQDAAE